ncbi:MAG: DNA polymerase III subunit alpha, partial [Bifidobacteriaceae bacterium]|nr:DNA polymerase III subunit alpha [Bifidobacteriaceae bacterium]
LRILRPDNFEDISAIQALYRPGPMAADSHTNYALRKNGQQEVTPIHPDLAEALDPILHNTYGLIVYQEQVMEIARQLAGYSLARADSLRRAMGKKKREAIDAEFEPFAAGMRERGFRDKAIQTLWDVLVPFSNYAFNKAHSASYGMISYWTAYLKAHYPVAYMAALLESVKRDKDRSAVYLAECRRMGITVLPPDVNSSAANFTPVGKDIRFGLAAVRNVGLPVFEAIAETRSQGGPFKSFPDFLDRVPYVVCHKLVIDSLNKAGAFDSLGAPRRAVNAIVEEALEALRPVKRAQMVGQFDLFEDLEGTEAADLGLTVPDLPEWDRRTKLGFEKEMIGLYVSDHPLAGLEHGLTKAATHSVANLVDPARPVEERTVVTVAGLLTSLSRKATKKDGKLWATASLEDLDGTIDVMFFPKAYESAAEHLIEDSVVAITGRVKRREERVEIDASELRVLAITEQTTAPPVTILMPNHRLDPNTVERLKVILSDHPGETEVRLKVVDNGRVQVLKLGSAWRVASGGPLFGDLKAAFGLACVV